VNGDLFIQKEGVSMGNPLGPSFANFHMSNLENTTFQDHPKLKPKFYARYVDDVLVIVDKFHHLTKLKTMFEQKSILKFTFETTEVKKKNVILRYYD
jgi:hypothetical protein